MKNSNINTELLNIMKNVIFNILLGLLALSISAQNKVAYCDFSNFPDGSIITNCFNISGKGVDKNPHYKKSLRLLGKGAYLFAEFNLNEKFDKVEIALEHLSSLSKGAKNDGYAPVTIQINGQNIISNYSPENHSFKVERFDITSAAHSGKNTLKIIANELQTHYWVKRFDVYTLVY